MPDEPNRSIEEQLKACAQKRRDEAGAPFELHPATRKLLQDEVARMFPKKSDEPAAAVEAAKPSEGWLKIFWPRFALAGSICALLLILFGLSIPTLFKDKAKTQRASAFNHLKQIGLAARLYANDHDGRLPANFQQMRDELGGASADTLVKDPETGKDFVYLGAGRAEADRDSVLAYSPIAKGRRPVLLADGYVQEMDDAQFNDALRRTPNGVTTVALVSPQASKPALAENKPLEQEVVVKAESKDARLKTTAQPAKAESLQSMEKSRRLDLAYADKAKEAAPPPPETSAATGGLNERGEVLLRQRYALARKATETGVVPADKEAPAPRLQAPAVADLQVALDGANVGRSVVGAGGLGGAAATTNQVAVNGRAVLFANQNGMAPDNYTLTLARQVSAATGETVSLARQRETDQLGVGNTHAYFANSAAQAGQRYAQVRRYRVNFNSPPMPNVLRSFQVEQAGQQIRVVDADGSVYDGAIEPPVSEEAAKRRTVLGDLKKSIEPEARRVESLSETTYGETAGQQTVFFRVAGTNRTLNQPVVFQGNFLADTNQTNNLFLGAKLEANQPAATPQQNLSLRSQQLPNAPIQGQATIGESNRIQINASPVGP